MRGRKRQSASIRDAKGNPGKRARTDGKNTRKPVPAVYTKPADLAVPPKVLGGMPRAFPPGLPVSLSHRGKRPARGLRGL